MSVGGEGKLATTQQEGGKFPEGTSGNPAGRPKGSKNKLTLLKKAIEVDIVEDIQEDIVGVLRKAVELALEGDVAMITLITNKFLPNAKLPDERKRNVGEALQGINITIGVIPGAEPIENNKNQTNTYDIQPIKEKQNEST